MSVRITHLRRPVEESEAELPEAIAARLGIGAGDVVRWRILRKSLDARRRDDLRFVYTVQVDLPDEEARLARLGPDPDLAAFVPEPFEDPPSGSLPLAHRPVVVGSGPAGLLAGYYLALRGYRPLILERGRPVKERVPAIRAFDRGGPFDPEDNYLFGEGGAGCFSDGKLTCRVTGPDVDWVLERFVECGGRASLTYEHRPHLGSNRLPMICRNFRRRIEVLGGEYRFACRFEGLDAADGRIRGVHTSSGFVPTECVFLGTGHSARDTYERLLADGLPLRAKAFQLGLRIEQPQECVDRHKYGRPEYRDLLGAADYSLVARGKRDLFSFCMCAGGIVIPSVSEPDAICTNGMSNSRHDTPYANSGLVVTLEPELFGAAHPLAGVALQRTYERIAFALAGGDFRVPIQRAFDFLKDRTPDPRESIPSSYERGVAPRNLSSILPPPVLHAVRAGLPILDRQWRGEYLKHAALVGPEMRGSSPVRIDRDPRTREVPHLAGVYPIGEGAGYAGGIVSAAVDGLRSAKVLVARHAPLEARA